MNPLNRSLSFVAGALMIAGCLGGRSGGDPVTSPAAPLNGDLPSASVSGVVTPLRDTGGTGILDPGTYVLDQFPVDLAFDIPHGDPPGWHVGYSRTDVATVLWYTPPEISYTFAFWTAENLYADPCNPTSGELEPPIGPSVDDLVAALSKQRGFRAPDPVAVTVGAFRGREIVLTAFDLGGDCSRMIPWTGGGDTADLLPGETLRVQIIDAEGVRIVTQARRPAQPDDAVEAALKEILDSIRIDSPS